MAAVRAGRRTLRCPSSWFLQQHHSHKLHCEAEHHLVAEPFPAKKKVSPLERFALRIQAAYERIRLKNLSPQLRAAAAAASAHTIRSESDLANVVEQRIWHSAVEGDFEHLPGKGKPLKVEGNPHADPAEDLLYRILSKNGFAPEWVELNKEIRFHMERWRRALRFSWSRKMDTVSGDESRREALWRADLRILEEELKDINKKVFHYNLIVPFGRQVFCYRMEDELRQTPCPLKYAPYHCYAIFSKGTSRVAEARRAEFFRHWGRTSLFYTTQWGAHLALHSPGVVYSTHFSPASLGVVTA